MNKTQKFLLATVALGIGLAIASVVYASRAANVFNGQTSNVTNNTTANSFPTNTCTSNFNGVATQYLCYPTNITTNSTQLLPSNDKYGFIRVVNNGAFAICVSPINPVIASNGFIVTAGGGSLTLPGTAGGLVPQVLYAAPTNAAAVGAPCVTYSEGWESPTGN